MEKRNTKERLLNRLENALGDMYHNATSHHPYNYHDSVSDFYWGWFNQQAEYEIDYLQSGMAFAHKEYLAMLHGRKSHMLREPWRRQYYHIYWLLKEHGKLYTYGRGGRTLAPEGLMKRYGCNDGVKKAYDFEEYSNAYLTELILQIEAFNSYVERWNSKENLACMWKEECNYQAGKYKSEAQGYREQFTELKNELKEAKKRFTPAICSAIMEKMRELHSEHKASMARAIAFQQSY